MIIRTPRTFFTRFGKVIFRGGWHSSQEYIFPTHSQQLSQVSHSKPLTAYPQCSHLGMI
jgi:hypothetical protein